MRSNIIYFVAFCASLWKKIRNRSVRKKSNSAQKFTTKINRTELIMEQIIANLLVADNAVIQKVSFIFRTNTDPKIVPNFPRWTHDFIDRNLHYKFLVVQCVKHMVYRIYYKWHSIRMSNIPEINWTHFHISTIDFLVSVDNICKN